MKLGTCEMDIAVLGADQLRKVVDELERVTHLLEAVSRALATTPARVIVLQAHDTTVEFRKKLAAEIDAAIRKAI